MLKSAHNRILAARFNFPNPQLLYRWSYQGMKITVRRVRKSSITLVISVWSDCSLIGSRIAVSNCGLQSSHEQTFHFEVFPGDSRMATCHCVYLIYMIALFLRWVNPSTRTHTFRLPSTMMWLCRFLVSADFVTYSWISYYARRFYPLLGQDCPRGGFHVFIWIPIELSVLPSRLAPSMKLLSCHP
jgi:hypothetical protein